MCTKVFLALWAQALFIQAVYNQCLSAPFGCTGPGFRYDRFPTTFGYNKYFGPLVYDSLVPWAGRGLSSSAYSGIDIAPTSSGGLIVTSASPVAPTGLSVVTETGYEGILVVAGEVPFVGTTGMEGVISTAGAAAVSHACGNGNKLLFSDFAGYSPYGSAAFAPVLGPAISPTIVPAYSSCSCGY